MSNSTTYQFSPVTHRVAFIGLLMNLRISTGIKEDDGSLYWCLYGPAYMESIIPTDT